MFHLGSFIVGFFSGAAVLGFLVLRMLRRVTLL